MIGYFVGMLANTLPLPGGVGGVDGGMIGMFVAFGVEPGDRDRRGARLPLLRLLAPDRPRARVSYATLRRTISRWEAEDAGEELPRREDRRSGARASQHHDRSLCHQYS